MNDPHALLPWFLNGTLSPEDSRRFEDHLPGCEACREELGLVGALRADLAVHGADLFGDHPEPEEILAAADPSQADRELTSDRSAEILRHLERCAACSTELGWLRGDTRAVAAPAKQERAEPAGEVAPERRAAPVLVGWLGWIGWAAAAAAVILLLVFPPGGPAKAPPAFTGIVSPAVVRSIERGRAEPAEILVPEQAAAVHILFEVDAGPESFPLDLEVTGPLGETLFREAALTRERLVAGAAIDFICDRQACPDGRYHARITTSEPGASPIEYAFRLTASPRGR